jgi:hypothetical protein
MPAILYMSTKQEERSGIAGKVCHGSGVGWRWEHLFKDLSTGAFHVVGMGRRAM